MYTDTHKYTHIFLATIVREYSKPKVHHGQPQGQRTPVEMLSKSYSDHKIYL